MVLQNEAENTMDRTYDQQQAFKEDDNKKDTYLQLERRKKAWSICHPQDLLKASKRNGNVESNIV